MCTLVSSFQAELPRSGRVDARTGHFRSPVHDTALGNSVFSRVSTALACIHPIGRPFRILELQFFDPEDSAEPESVAPPQVPERSKERKEVERIRPSLPMTDESHKAERAALRDAYLAQLSGPKIKVLDICWAVSQHYTEWKRWLRSAVKDGSTPDLAFRAILTSAKRPEKYRKRSRPDGWK
jgi:hypothetical protein